MTTLSNNLEERIAALRGPLDAVCARLRVEAAPFGLGNEDGPDLAKAAGDLKRDPFTGEYSLELRWKAGPGQARSGSIVIHPDGSFFAEYDVLVTHPDKPTWFVEAVTAWGRGDNMKSEPRLLPMPEDDVPPAPTAIQPTLPADVRLIVLHKHRTSARVRILRFDATALGFAPLPAGNWQETQAEPELLHHPVTVGRSASAALGVEAAQLKVDGGFRRTLANDGQLISVLLAECTDNEPPFLAAEGIGGRFVSLTEIRDLPLIERELLRSAYEHVLG